MKPLKLLLLITVFTATCSFRQGDSELKGSFFATLDGKPFLIQEDQLFRGLLMNKSATVGGKPQSRTVISTTINGQSYDITPDKLFTESLQFEINYENEKTGVPSYYAAALQFQSAKYYLLKEQSKLTITQFNWENDKKYFRISADFDCKMRSWGYPNDGIKDVNLKGSFSNLRITVPSWLATKN
ncbi:MAG: hypothetical protein V4615_05580 [Bacteroidota bacterium]